MISSLYVLLCISFTVQCWGVYVYSYFRAWFSGMGCSLGGAALMTLVCLLTFLLIHIQELPVWPITTFGREQMDSPLSVKPTQVLLKRSTSFTKGLFLARMRLLF